MDCEGNSRRSLLVRKVESVEGETFSAAHALAKRAGKHVTADRALAPPA